MRSIIFRVSAGLLSVASVWALAVGGMQDLAPFERVMMWVLASVFAVYCVAGDRAAESMLTLLSGHPTEKPGNVPDEMSDKASSEEPS
jgi:peptidoglycan/LPS O-acetylase OafA/YrhL